MCWGCKGGCNRNPRTSWESTVQSTSLPEADSAISDSPRVGSHHVGVAFPAANCMRNEFTSKFARTKKALTKPLPQPLPQPLPRCYQSYQEPVHRPPLSLWSELAVEQVHIRPSYEHLFMVSDRSHCLLFPHFSTFFFLFWWARVVCVARDMCGHRGQNALWDTLGLGSA